MFASGIPKSIRVPVGTKKDMFDHISNVETTLKIKREKYRNNPEHWITTDYADIDDKVLCETAERHNWMVRWFYYKLTEWSEKPVKSREWLTIKDFEKILPALQLITVSPERWTSDYYRSRMNVMYEVMRGREEDGISFDEKPLTVKQAAQVINLFSEFLDVGDLRLDVPKGEDTLMSLSEGEYEWCEKCGAVTYEHAQACRKSGCPIEKELDG
jgi:hypothetical protein